MGARWRLAVGIVLPLAVWLAAGCGGEKCGNGRLNGGEGCDDGNAAAGDGCDPACAVEAGWMCDRDGCCRNACEVAGTPHSYGSSFTLLAREARTNGARMNRVTTGSDITMSAATSSTE